MLSIVTIAYARTPPPRSPLPEALAETVMRIASISRTHSQCQKIAPPKRHRDRGSQAAELMSSILERMVELIGIEPMT